MTDRLGTLLGDAAHGRFPAADGALEIVGSPPGKADAVVAFTAHAVVATSLDPADVRAHVPSTDLGAPMDPRFLAWLAARLGTDPGVLDVVLVVLPDQVPPREDRLRIERRDDLVTNPRVARALAHRTDVRVYADAQRRGVAAIGRGLAGRWELSVELDVPGAVRGIGESFIVAALREAEPDEPLFAQVSPGNARSLRAFLNAGFRPIGSEVLFLVR
jgi:hypothetical protein